MKSEFKSSTTGHMVGQFLFGIVGNMVAGAAFGHTVEICECKSCGHKWANEETKTGQKVVPAILSQKRDEAPSTPGATVAQSPLPLHADVNPVPLPHPADSGEPTREKQVPDTVAPIKTRPENWEQLLGAIQTMKDEAIARQLSNALPYHVQFVLLTMKLDELGYYNQIPYLTVTPELVRKTKQYVEDPQLHGMLAIFPGKLDADRFRVLGGGQIGRMTNPVTDSSIVSTASCLLRQKVSLSDLEAVGRFAFDAIKHYAGLPTVRFTFSLPYIHESLRTRQIDPIACQVEIYKATEALLLEIWDELGEGQVITDERVNSKVRGILSGSLSGREMASAATC